MSFHPASDKQIGYAESLVDYLEKEQHYQAARFRANVENSQDCIGDMSKLIDNMKGIRTEIQEADKEMR